MDNAEYILIEVVAALPERQVLIALSVPAKITAREALAMATIDKRLPELDCADCPLAVWGEPVSPERVLGPGDRLEILRPLQIDPRDARRQLANAGQVMGPASGTEDQRQARGRP